MFWGEGNGQTSRTTATLSTNRPDSLLPLSACYNNPSEGYGKAEKTTTLITDRLEKVPNVNRRTLCVQL